VCPEFNPALVPRREIRPEEKNSEASHIIRKSGMGSGVTPGNVPEPIALAIHAAAIHHAKLTLKISKKMTKTGRALVRALRAPGQVIHVIGDASRIARDTEAAWMIYGKDSTIVDIRSRLPRNIPAGEMGERFSISIIFKSALKRGISLMVRECARDIRTYDQKGCLSAQILWVQGDADAARSFGQKLLLELQRLDKSEGRFKRGPGDRHCKNRFSPGSLHSFVGPGSARANRTGRRHQSDCIRSLLVFA
jgi:hypothetical protein